MASELALPAKCRLCGMKFFGPKVTIVGSNRSTAFLGKLVKHLQIEHQHEASQIAMGAMEYQGMLVMAYYLIDDPELGRMHDVARWNIHQKTLSCKISDQQIMEAVDQLLPDIYTLISQGDKDSLRGNLCGFIAGLRDKLEEPNKYDLRGEPVEAVKLS